MAESPGQTFARNRTQPAPTTQTTEPTTSLATTGQRGQRPTIGNADHRPYKRLQRNVKVPFRRRQHNELLNRRPRTREPASDRPKDSENNHRIKSLRGIRKPALRQHRNHKLPKRQPRTRRAINTANVRPPKMEITRETNAPPAPVPMPRIRIADLQPNIMGASIEARVSSKTTLRQRSREDEKLSVFSFVIQDETARVNVTAWDEVANRIYDTMKVGRCFKTTMFKVKEPNPQYRITEHKYELTLTKWSEVTESPDDDLPPLRTDLQTIIELRGKEPNAIVDLLAVVFEIGPLQFINCQDGEKRQKRNITLVDDSTKLITLGLWPDFTEVLNDNEGKAIIFQNLQLREYNGKPMLSTTTNTIISAELQHETVLHLKEWFREEGCRTQYEELN